MHVLGINPDGDYFKVALLTFKHRKIKINLIQEYKKDILDLDLLKKEILEKTQDQGARVETISALTADEIFTRRLTLPVKSRRAVLKALPFQMEALLPFSKEDSMTIPKIKKSEVGSDITLFSFLNDTMANHLQEIKTLGFDPDYVSTIPNALYRFARAFTVEEKPLIIVHFGWERSYVVCIDRDEIVYSVSLSSGFKNFIDAIKADYPDLEEIDFAFIREEIERNAESDPEDGYVAGVLASTKKELNRVLEFLDRKCPVGSPEAMLFTGYADIVKHVTQVMDKVTLRIIKPSPHLEYDEQQLTSYAIEIGLSLDRLENDGKSLQLRLGKFTSIELFDRIKKKAVLYVGLVCLCGVMGFLTTSAFLFKKQENIRGRFNQIVQLGGESVDDYPEMKHLVIARDGCHREVKALEEKFRSQRNEGLFLTQPTLTTDCFLWFISEIIEGIEVRTVSYDMLGFPDVLNPKNPYNIQFTLRYSAKNEALGKTFYEAVKSNASKSIIQSAFKEVSGDYEVVFNLKAPDPLL